MEFSNLKLEFDASVAKITVDRPKVLNALDRATLLEFDAALDAIEAHEQCRVIIVTGGGEKAFVAGADIAELANNAALDANVHGTLGQGIFSRLESLGRPSIAAINGFALGGGLELAMACTIRIASSKARMGLPEVTLGLIPGFGGTQRLSRLVGQGRAMELVLTGRMVDAAEAERIGLVTQVVEPDELAAAAGALAAKLSAFSGSTLRIAEETVRRGAEMAFEDALAYEAAQFGLVSGTEDAREGMDAFLNKRKAEFKGR